MTKTDFYGGFCYMGHKIFVSYKYADSNVKNISGNIWPLDTVRTYVDKLEEYISDTSEHIYKGETDREDLSILSEDTIWEKLKNKIYDSSLTIIMISSGMKESKADKEQWIPWEISYSLKEPSRKNKNGNPVTSKSNALLAIIVPDANNSYEYYTYNKSCCTTGCRMLKTNHLFDIMAKNMFNIKNPNTDNCDDGSVVYHGDSSYITSVKWDDFITDPEKYIKKAYSIQENINSYNIKKDV